jgi:uncharacterized protein
MLCTLPKSLSAAPDRLAAPHGNIEVAWSLPAQTPRGWMVIGHPHPLFGGAMGNKVVHSMAMAAAASGWLALRFNFRGVGRSEGVHDGGRAETTDYLWLANFLGRLGPGLPRVFAGFSFGGFVALRATETMVPEGVLTVAPPLTKYVALPQPARPPVPWRLIHGREDDVVTLADTEAALSGMEPPDWIRVDGTGHFFHGRLDVIKSATSSFLEQI